MRKFTLILILGSVVSVVSCGQRDPNKNLDEGKVEGNFYTSDEIGWTMEIPEGWNVVDIEETKASQKRGMEAMEETLESEIDYSGLKNLIVFQKNQLNIFQSSSEPFALEYEGEWEENNSALKGIIYATYEDQGLTADSSATTTEVIDGLEFTTYSFTIYGPKGDVILRQQMFSRLINGFDFGVNLNYNNDKDRDEMLKVFRNSKFRK